MWNQPGAQGIYYSICGLALLVSLYKCICASRRIYDDQDFEDKNDYNSEERARTIKESVIVKVRNSIINIFILCFVIFVVPMTTCILLIWSNTDSLSTYSYL